MLLLVLLLCMKEALREFGLNERETEVYLALVRLKEATAPTLATRTKINKSTVYLELENLMQKGLASFVIKEKIKYFKPANPSTFLDILESRKESIRKIIPKLSSLSSFEKPVCTIYEGKEGLKTAITDIISENKQMLVFGACGNIFEVLQRNFPHLLKRFLATNITAKYIVNAKKRQFEKRFPKERSQVRYLDVPSKVATIVYGDKVSIQSLEGEPYVAIIEDKNLAQSYRNYFLFMWDAVGKSR